MVTVYDNIDMGNGKKHPLAGVPQEVLDDAYQELRDAFYWDGADMDDVRSVAESIVLKTIVGLNLDRMVDDAYQDGVEDMKKVAESFVGQPLPEPQGQLF